MTAEARTVRIVPEGPMLIEGPVHIVLDDASTVDCSRFVVAICCCRRSQTYPLCDTSHRRTGKSRGDAEERHGQESL
jgi:CDGSH-type Zn-finger protein